MNAASASPFFRACLRLLLVLTLAGSAAAVQAQAEVSAIPSTFSPGAKIKVNVQGLALSTDYRLRLEAVRPATAEFDLQDFSSGSATTAIRSVTVPAAAAGSYDIVLYRVSLGTTRLAEGRVTVVVSSLTLTPAQAAPGRSVSFSATDLVAGSVRVIYAGKTVLGPVPVGTGTYNGKFIVPADRPANLPATVPVVLENLVGRLVARRATASFSALAPSIGPHLGLQSPQIPATQLGPSTPFTVRGRLLDDDGMAPTGRQQAYFIGGGVTVPLDTGTQLGSDGTLVMQAIAPGALSDGLTAFADRPGHIVLVSQGTDRHTGTSRDSRFGIVDELPLVIDGDDGSAASFTVVVRRYPSAGGGLIRGAIVEADEIFQGAFYGAARKGGVIGMGEPLGELEVLMSSQPNQTNAYDVANRPRMRTENYGCDITFFRKITNENGVAGFVIRPEDIAGLNFGEIEHGACHYCRPAGDGDAAKGAAFTSRASFNMTVHGAHLGLRNTSVAIEYDGDNNTFYDISTGDAFQNNRVEVFMEAMQETDFDLRNLLIDGVGPPEQHYPPGDCPVGSGGVCYEQPFRWHSMYTYPSTSLWPSGSFDAFNVGRKARLQIDPAVYGPLASGRIRIGNTAWANFDASGETPGCLLDADEEVAAEKVEYIASLPDLTRLPAGDLDGVVELRFGSTATRSFPIKVRTQAPAIHVQNPNVATLRINALNDNVYGTYNTPGQSIPVDSPGHGVGRLDSMTENAGSFSIAPGVEGTTISNLVSTTNNDVADNPGGTETVQGAFFGFSDGNNTVPETLTLFDTGIIPLFRYSFGIPPIAAATLGADFWMAATLKYYGQLRPEGMNATIDPRLAGGVNLFFDLDVLGGIVSGSISAESEMGIAMRAKINQGGLAHRPNNPSLPAGRCFTFDLDGVWEACAVGICATGRENIIQVREPSNNCSANRAAEVPLMLRGVDGKLVVDDGTGRADFDLARPFYTANALGGDGRGHAISVGVTAAGDLKATHVTGGVVEARRTIARETVAVQHLDVAFYAPDRAIAVWSENSQSRAAIEALMHAQGARAFDDIARTQRLRWSQWNGVAWSAPADLTSLGNDGKPQLAGCLAAPRYIGSACPTSGEVTVVWERDANQNLDAPDLEVWSAQWRPGGGGWTDVQRVSAAGNSSDMLPSVAYRNDVAIVAWAHNAAGAFANLSGRQAAYRFLDGTSSMQIATSLGRAVGWVDIGVSSADSVVIAFTRAQDPQGFIGNRQALVTARATSCTGGVCAFLATEVRDPHERQIRVERPRVAFDENDTPVIGFRALAFGPDAQGNHALPGDLPGITLGTGELGMVRVHTFAQPQYTAQLVGLSDDGLQHWKPDFVYDETMGGVLAVSMQAVEPAGAKVPLEIAKLMSPEGSPTAKAGVTMEGGGELRTVMAGPDFSLRDAQLSRAVAAGGQSVRLTLTLDNIGTRYVPADHGSVKLVASLNGPAGSGEPLGSYTVPGDQLSNASRDVSFAFTLPAHVRADERNTVFIDIDADDEANANDGTSDHDRIELNAMPVPQRLSVATRPGMPLVNLTWFDPVDSRIAGWRVWRLDAQGNWRHVGSTRVAGYADVRGNIGGETVYRVASYSANGMESEPSAAVMAAIQEVLGDTIFADGFD